MKREELLALLEDGIESAVVSLVKRIEEGQASAADIGQLRALFKDAGGSLTMPGSQQPNQLGDSVLTSMADIDPDLIN